MQDCKRKSEAEGSYFCILPFAFNRNRSATAPEASEAALQWGRSMSKTSRSQMAHGAAFGAARIVPSAGTKYKSPVGDVDLIRLGQ
jgi:hypothetical protein